MRKIVMGLSGGMDSATLLGILLEQGYEVHCCTFSYGSKHNKYENRAAEELIDYYLYKGFPVVGHPYSYTDPKTYHYQRYCQSCHMPDAISLE